MKYPARPLVERVVRLVCQSNGAYAPSTNSMVSQWVTNCPHNETQGETTRAGEDIDNRRALHSGVFISSAVVERS